jgi:histidine triad (HIT) family protein
VLLSTPDLVAFRDIHPRASTHILIIPRKHVSSVSELEPGDAELVGKLFLAARDLAREEGIATRGFRMVINDGPDARQSVFHLHLHLLGGRRLGWPPG